jgi:hypothetical protein
MAQTAVAPDRQALAIARRTPGSPEAKVIAYFEALPEAGATRHMVRRVQRTLWLVTLLGRVLALVAGAATLRTAFGADGGLAINFYGAMISLLGLNTLVLLAWVVTVAIAPRTAGDNSLGAALLGLWRVGLKRLGGAGGTPTRAALAVGRRVGAARLWVVSAVSHSLWAAFLAGACLMAVILLSTRQYVFRWETTILDAESYVALTHALAWLPRALGLPVPTDAAIRAAQWHGGGIVANADQAGWVSLLFSCLILYGLVPRLVLLAFSLWRARRIMRAPLDLSRPDFAALIPHLAPVVEHTRIVSPAPTGTPRPAGGPIPGAAGLPLASGPVAVAGWEVETGNALPAPVALDLGLVDGAQAMNRAVEALTTHRPRIARLVVIADLSATPDRGVTAGLKRLAAAGPETMMLFTGGAALVKRLGQPQAADRLTDWVSAAHAAGIALEYMTEIDLEEAEALPQWRKLTGEPA